MDDNIDLGGSITDGLSEVTAMAWFNIDDFSNLPQWGCRANNDSRFQLFFRSDGTIDGIIGDGSASGDPPDLNNDGATLSTNTWHHVAWVYSANDYFTKFLDGSETGGRLSISEGAVSTNGLNEYVGARNDGDGITGPTDGRVACVRFYDTALSESEIENIYNVVSTPGEWLSTGKVI